MVRGGGRQHAMFLSTHYYSSPNRYLGYTRTHPGWHTRYIHHGITSVSNPSSPAAILTFRVGFIGGLPYRRSWRRDRKNRNSTVSFRVFAGGFLGPSVVSASCSDPPVLSSCASAAGSMDLRKADRGLPKAGGSAARAESSLSASTSRGRSHHLPVR